MDIDNRLHEKIMKHRRDKLLAEMVLGYDGASEKELIGWIIYLICVAVSTAFFTWFFS